MNSSRPVPDRPQLQPPEVPRRPAATHPGPVISAPSVPAHQRLPRSNSQPAIREIHKNAWLKRHAASEKKGTPLIKKLEKFWVVFCVHDDTEAFLEFYAEPKMCAAHKPLSRVSINTCLHVSPSIMGQDNEFSFAVSLPSQVIRLTAANWDQMQEWVESLQGKLREMNILKPKENLYSALPDRSCNNSNPSIGIYNNYISSTTGVSTSYRDPNSPLPPTPPLRPDGSRVPHGEDPFAIYVDTTQFIEPNQSAPGTTGPSRNLHLDFSNSNSNGFVFDSSSEASALIYVQPSTGGSSSREGSGSDSGNGSGGSLTSVDIGRVPPPPSRSHPSSCSSAINESIIGTKAKLPVGSQASGSNSNGVTYTTVVQIGSEFIRGGPSAPPVPPNPFQVLPNPLEGLSSSVTSIILQDSEESGRPVVKPRPEATLDSSSFLVAGPGTSPNSYERQLSAPPQLDHPHPASASSENLYEHLYIPSNSLLNTNVVRTNSVRCGARKPREVSPLVGTSGDSPPPLIPRNPLNKRLQKGNSAAPHRSSSLSRLETVGVGLTNDPLRTNDESRTEGINDLRQQVRRHRTPRPEVINHNFSEPSASEANPMESMIGVRSGEYRIRREEALNGQQRTKGTGTESTAPSPAQASSSTGSDEAASTGAGLSSHVPLKEQQVIRLQSEISHPGGVRVVLRKKDCVGSIAFVDYLGAVWIAGWKQQMHPVLYYAFHVGDQIKRVAGVSVQNSIEATRAIKMVSSMQVEFIVQRLPYGKVFVLKRTREGEALGLVAIGNSGEIGEVIPTGLAAGQGLTPRAVSADGHSTCNWYLTEVNNRPLNLFARENEVRERLNAVGREISFLVQPSDLVKHLRKQLKSIKGYKDYLVI